jgi:hypothetical protein
MLAQLPILITLNGGTLFIIVVVVPPFLHLHVDRQIIIVLITPAKQLNQT